MKGRKLLAFCIAGGIALTIAGNVFADGPIGPGEDEPNTEETDGTLTIQMASEPSAIWGTPGAKTENEGQMISSCLLDTLVDVEWTTMTVNPNLATDWEWVDDTHCKFTLRDDVTMYGGSTLTADDVVYTVNLWTEYSGSNDTGKFIDSSTTTANDDGTVTIGFNVVAPDMLYMLGWSNFGIVCEADVEAAGGIEESANNPVIGSGKYKFVEWKNGESITIERNEDYWNPDYAGYYKTIVFKFTNDAASRAMAVQSGDAQVALDMPVSQASTYVADSTLKIAIHSFGQNAHLWYNMTDEHATSDILVRQAIDKALNFDAICAVGSGGYAEPSLGYFTADSIYYNETYTTDERAVDIDGAKELLEEAGYADGLELTIIGMQDTVPLYTVIQANLAEAGITVDIETVDTAQFVEDAFAGNYDLIMVGELTDCRYPTLMCFLQQSYVDSGYVIGGPKATTEEINSAILEAIEETDQETAKEELGSLEQIYKDSCIVSNLYPEQKAVAMGIDIKGYDSIERGFVDCTSFYE